LTAPERQLTGDGRDVWTVRRETKGYPGALLDLAERAPEAIHGFGDASVLADWDAATAVTIVGSRRASSYGVAVAEELGRLAAAAGLLVVSGMARGIDAAAHRGALAGDGKTVAVLGGGPDVVYPAGEWRLYRSIVAHGAAISEWPAGEPPAAWCFPARNRIMAALSQVTVVVEGAARSGSLITAREAADLNRTVGAVPGPVNSWLSAGPNNLLSDGALVVRDAQDVLDAMLGVGARNVRRAGPDLEPHLSHVLGLVEGGRATCDAVAAAWGDPPREAAIALARLELLGYVRVDATGRYARTTLIPPAGSCSSPDT
jgi:DNA processing protein